MHGCNIVMQSGVAFWAKSSDSSSVIDASVNWWGVADADSIEMIIRDHLDEPTYATVNYIPFADEPFDFQDPTSADAFDPAGGQLPLSFALRQNHPNPFNVGTRIEFFVPYESHVSIVIYNALGQRVRSILNEYRSSGPQSVSWDGTDSRGRQVSTGIYFYRLRTEDYSETRKMLLLK